MKNPGSHYFHVTIKVGDVGPNVHSGKLRLVMPVWTPGSYLVREFSRNVLDFAATETTSGRQLPSYKESKNSWAVEVGQSEAITVQYSVYAFEFTVDTSYCDNLHALINGGSVFMYVEGMEKEPITLKVEKLPSWKVVSTGLESISTEPAEFFAPDFDILVDSPIEIGNQQVHSFEVSGIQHQVSIYSQRNIDQSNFVNDLKKIVESTVAVIGQIPYKRYVFLVDFTGNDFGGGLEHLNSTHCIAPFFALEPPNEYRRLMGLFSHEFFHAWNVKRMRPKGLGPFNYSAETYTKSLWIAEGITSYYDDLILRRCGIYSVPDYLEAFCVNVNLMVSLPGGKWQSAEEASFDSWIKHYRPNENSPNVLCSYYTQGAVIGWMLDLEIRRKTESRKSLDDVMRLVYERTYLKENSGYTDEEFESACNEIAGDVVTSEIYETRVQNRKPVDFQRYLGYAGLQLTPKSKPESEQGFLGVKMRSDTGRSTIANVLVGTGAEQSGISAGDEVIGVDSLRVDISRLSAYISNRRPGSSVRLTTARDGALFETNVELGLKPPFEYRIIKADTASEEQKNVFKYWLLAKYEDEIKYVDYPPSPVRKQIFDFI
jgi:predicted metalloprotease with PDZ domain